LLVWGGITYYWWLLRLTTTIRFDSKWKTLFTQHYWYCQLTLCNAVYLCVYVSIKLGVMEDHSNRTRLAKLLRFYSSNSDTEMTSLAEYVERMKEKQEHIYFIAGTSRKEVERSPFVERLLKKGYEVECSIHITLYESTCNTYMHTTIYIHFLHFHCLQSSKGNVVVSSVYAGLPFTSNMHVFGHWKTVAVGRSRLLCLVVSTLDQRPRGRGFECAGCRLSCSNRGQVALCTLGLGLLNPPSSRGR